MPAVLAIDAAWTLTEPSGVALVRSVEAGWRCEAVAPSYDSFIALPLGENVNWSQSSFRGSAPNMNALLTAARRLLGTSVDLITIDMPISTVPITCRRAADNAISTKFGGRWCSAHSPSLTRPGILSTRLTAELKTAGYRLATANLCNPTTPQLLEVYPHPALLSLMKRTRRVPYKISKSGKYWPDLTVRERIDALLKEFGNIRAALDGVFESISLTIPSSRDVPTLSFLKRYEDALDALVCGWVGVQFLLKRSVPLGDETAAIWCPMDVVLQAARESGQKIANDIAE